MTREQIWVATLQKAIRANFCIQVGKSLKASPEYEDSMDVAIAMYYGLITDKFGEEYAKNLCFMSGLYEYDELIQEYKLILEREEEDPKRPKKTWYRYQNKKELVLRYFKYGKK
jgi:hypothetical protein